MAYYIWKSYKFEGDPYELFYILRGQRHCFFLDSSSGNRLLGRYSFIGYDPFCVLRPGKDDLFSSLRNILDLYRIDPAENMPPFLGGGVGFFGYDLGFGLEKKLKKVIADDIKAQDYFIGFYDVVIIIDHYLKEMMIFSCGFPETKSNLIRGRAEERFKDVERLLLGANCVRLKKCYINKKSSTSAVSSNFTRQGYIQAIKKAKDHISRGDIYQLNLSQRFSAKTILSAQDIHARLRALSPADFSAYLDCGDFQIISSSPERFLSLQGRTVRTRPMKGTRPRSSDKSRDTRFKNELLQSPKDKAELLMIVDLERNDLGRVCEYGSVNVKSLRQIEKYRTVYQTTAAVEGILHKDKDRIDLIKSCFPGGSITGCPKIRSMQIIEELEPTRRAVYTGSLGYLSFSGTMDLNILIRTILKKGDDLYFQAGGGIVADSDPQDEYRETLVKAKAMFEAIR